MKKRPGQLVSCSKQPEEKEERIDYALGYVKTVKETMLNENKKEKYEEFSKILKDFQANNVDVTGTIEKVKELFKGHEDLVLGFNIFLPEEFQINLPLKASVQCSICSKNFDTSTDLKKHLRRHNYSCFKCRKMFHSKIERSKHMEAKTCMKK